MQGYMEQGNSLLNSDPALGFKTSARAAASVDYIDTFFEDLFSRGW